MIAVIVPAHNEQEFLAPCLQAIARAAYCTDLHGEAVLTVAVLDSCTDDSEIIARRLGVQILVVQARNVGKARHAGAVHALAAGARWLAFTDADTRVSPKWLSSQLALADAGADAVCGTVDVDTFDLYGDGMAAHFANTYTDCDGHRHVHGANLGVSAAAYLRVGGFAALASSEDVALVEALARDGAHIAWSAAPRVTTSARRDFRAPGGFGQTLCDVDSRLAELAA